MAVAASIAAPALAAPQYQPISVHRLAVRCDGHRPCIERVAKADCVRRPADRWHCAIYHRNQWRVEVAHAAKVKAAAAPSISSTTAWAWTYTTFDACVVMHESTNNQFADNGVDESYYQWLPATWQQAQRDVGVSFSSSPFDATLAQQSFVFNLWEPVDGHRTQWPYTVPLCGG